MSIAPKAQGKHIIAHELLSLCRVLYRKPPILIWKIKATESLVEHRMGTEITKKPWGDRLDSVRIFFDNVRFIPQGNQRGKRCTVCGCQATYVKLDLLERPLAFYCDRDVLEARRGR